MIRAEVRVYWVASNVGDDAIEELPCGPADDPPDVDALARAGIVHAVYATTAITKNEAR
jgi:hypothetical protein